MDADNKAVIQTIKVGPDAIVASFQMRMMTALTVKHNE